MTWFKSEIDGLSDELLKLKIRRAVIVELVLLGSVQPPSSAQACSDWTVFQPSNQNQITATDRRSFQ